MLLLFGREFVAVTTIYPLYYVMEVIQRKIMVPASHSFIINELDLTQNRGVVHNHRNYELNYMVNARGQRYIAGNVADFYEKDLVLLGPGLPHCWEISNKEDLPHSVTIHFNESFFNTSLFSIPEFKSIKHLLDEAQNGLFFPRYDDDKLRSLMSALPHLSDFEAIIQMLRILEYLSQLRDYQLISPGLHYWNINNFDDDRLKKVHRYVLQHFQQGIRLKEAADLINLSEGAFCSFFKRSTKKSFFTFVKEVKIDYACQLLTNSVQKSVSEICFESGFNNLANFNRQFKEITSMSPTEYRAKY